MRCDVKAAIENARAVEIQPKALKPVEPQRQRSFQAVRALVYAVVQELPSDMTLGELCDELCISAVQERNTNE
jgi:hypothetical protein